MKRASIGGMSFTTSTDFPVSRPRTSPYAMRSRCTAAGSSMVSFTGLSSGIADSFSLFTMSALIRRKHEVAVDDHAHRKAGPDGDCRLDIEIAANNLLTGLIETVRAAAPERGHDGAVAARGSEFGANAEHGRERGRREQAAPMMIDVIFEAREPLSVGAGLAFEHDGVPVRHEQPGPDQQDPVLPERDLAVVEPNELRSLQNQQKSAAWAVIDVLGDLGGDLPRQVGSDPGDQGGRNDRAGLDNITGWRIGEPIRADGPALSP
jgi:hypothetical protein